MYIRIVETNANPSSREHHVHYTLMNAMESSEIEDKNELIEVLGGETTKIIEEIKKSPISFCTEFKDILTTERTVVIRLVANSSIESIRLFTEAYFKMGINWKPIAKSA